MCEVTQHYSKELCFLHACTNGAGGAMAVLWESTGVRPGGRYGKRQVGQRFGRDGG